MSKESVIIDFLKSYTVYKKFIQSQEYAIEYFDPTGKQKMIRKERYESKMHLIESLIQLLEPSDEYTLLHLHYIDGITVEKCAECMYISSRTAYRMLNKAHKLICEMTTEEERKRADNEQRAD